MKKWLLHIFLVSVLGMLTASCSQNADDPTQDVPSKSADAEKVTIRFTIDLGEQSGMGSRAAWEGYDDDETSDSDTAEEGIGNENYINTSNLQVFLFNTNGTYIGGLKDMEANQTSTAHIYEIKGEVDVVKSAIVNEKLNCKIMVVANADAATTDATSGEVTGYNYNAVFNHNVTSIPMWGIGTYEIDLIKQLQVDLDEPIYMLRSMAKIEVTLKENLYTNGGYRIMGATLSNYNTQGYVIPTFMIPETDETDETTQPTTQIVDLSTLVATTDLLTDGVLRPIANKLANANKSFSDVDNTKKTYVIYVPEMPKGTDDNPIKVNLRLGKVAGTNDDGSEKITEITSSVMNGTPHFELKDYSEENKGHYDIIRNWYYRYTINTISDGIDATLTVKANDWTQDDETWNYTEVVTVERNMTWTSSNPTDTDENVTVVYEETKDDNDEILTKVPTVYIPWATSTDYATCTFKITAPVGATWIASFEPIEGNVGAFKFLNENNEQVSQMTGKVGTDATLKIVTALSDRTETRKARLLIAVRTWDERIIRVDNLIAEQGITEKEFTLVQPKNN